MLLGTSQKINWAALNEEVDPALHARQEEHIGIVNHCENAMDSLNAAQLDMEKKLEHHYAGYLSEPANAATCDLQMIQFIHKEYRKAPAMYRGQALPVEYDASLNQSPEIELCYLLHPAHSAYRYLVLRLLNQPNQWMHPQAEFLKTYTTMDGVEYKGPELGLEQLNVIRAMWLAINDPKFMIAEGYTREGLKQMFLELMATFARVHNWDKTRPVKQEVINEFGQKVMIIKTRMDPEKGLVPVMEAYDDQHKDQPTCLAGVTQRNSQFIMLSLKADPNERKLDAILLKNKFREELITALPGKNNIGNIIDKMDQPTLLMLQEALDDLIPVSCGDWTDLTADQKKLLLPLQSYTTEDLRQFINGCKAFFGDYRFTQTLKSKVEFMSKLYANYGQLIIGISQDPWGVFYTEITQLITNRLDALRNGKANVAVKAIGNSPQELMNVSLAALNQGMGALVIESKKKNESMVKSTVEIVQDKVLAEAKRRAEVSRLIAESREAEISLLNDQKLLIIENVRQAVLNYAMEHHAEVLADRMSEAGIGEMLQNLEDHERADQIALELRDLDDQIYHGQRTLGDQNELRLQMEREHQREIERTEEIRKAEETKRVEVARLEAIRQAEMQRRAEAARRKAEEQRKAAEEAARRAEEARLAEERRQEELRRQQAEAARLAEERRQEELCRQQAEAARLAAEERHLAVMHATISAPPILNAFNAPELLLPIAAKFGVEPIRQQLLANLNSSPEAVQILNQNAHGVVEVLIHNIEVNDNMTARLVQLTPQKMVQFLTGLQAKAEAAVVAQNRSGYGIKQ